MTSYAAKAKTGMAHIMVNPLFTWDNLSQTNSLCSLNLKAWVHMWQLVGYLLMKGWLFWNSLDSARKSRALSGDQRTAGTSERWSHQDVYRWDQQREGRERPPDFWGWQHCVPAVAEDWVQYLVYRTYSVWVSSWFSYWSNFPWIQHLCLMVRYVDSTRKSEFITVISVLGLFWLWWMHVADF